MPYLHKKITQNILIPELCNIAKASGKTDLLALKNKQLMLHDINIVL